MLNTQIYIFGQFESGYRQYPDDYSSDIFRKFEAGVTSKSQITIHRDKNLMYYGYIQKLDERQQYIGFCIVLNDVLISSIKNLFTVFERAVEELALRGEILTFNENGNVVASTYNLLSRIDEMERVASIIRNGVENKNIRKKKLPPLDYSISIEESKDFVVSAPVDEIVNASAKYGYTYVRKEEETSSMIGYKSIIKQLKSEKDELLSQKKEIQERYATLNKQKKQFKVVLLLCLILVLSGAGLFLLKNNLKGTQQELSNTKRSKVELQNTIDRLNTSIGEKEAELTVEKQERRLLEDNMTRLESDIEDLNRIILSRQPMLIKSTSFNWSSGYLSFEYYGFDMRNINLTAKALNGDESYSNSCSFTIEKGNNTGEIFISRNLNSSIYYSFELLIDNKILGGDRH